MKDKNILCYDLKLGVNIDHVATLRRAREENFPDPVTAALIAEQNGADGITCHLREDRRHITERDLRLLSEMVKTRLNLEMSIIPEIVEIALENKPDQATLVPERRKEITTEGGLEVAARIDMIKSIVQRLKDKDIFVSLFIDPDESQIKAAHEVGADAIELHTGSYARLFKTHEKEEELKRLSNASKLACSLGLKVFAGHGLDYNNVSDILNIKEIEELNIGFSIISRAVFIGLPFAVREMKDLIKRGNYLCVV